MPTMVPTPPAPPTDYGGAWVVFYPDTSGVTLFPTPDEAWRYALDKSAWVTFLAWGVDLAEFIEQITEASRRKAML
jgi:hypothetical protein